MTQSPRKFAVLALALINAFVILAASEDTDPEPIPTTTNPSDAENPVIPAMPLSLYQSLRAKMMSLADSETQTSVNPVAAPVIAPQTQQKKLELLRQEVQAHEPRILAALSSPRSIQRELAARALIFCAEKKPAVAALCAALEKDPDPDVRRSSAITLGKLSDAAALDALVNGMQDEAEEVRIHSAASLGALCDERAIPTLMQALQSDLKPRLRMQAALSLARIKSGISEDDLSPLLHSETDERVKMAIAAAIRAVNGSETPDISEIPGHLDYRMQLADLSSNMLDVENKLRDDRHDEIVQVDQKDIDDKLGDMIRELEKMQRMSSNQKEETERHKDRQRRMAMLGQQKSPQRPTRPGNTLGPAQADSAMNARSVIGRNERWATLPPKDRDELLQIFRPEVPLRWRKRLEAYFVSIAAEETRESRGGTASKANQE